MSSQEFVGMMNNADAPWNTLSITGENQPWTDSAKEQYFSLLNAEQANQHEIDMWRLNNEYNIPRKQMERLIEAGINPAAAFNQVSSGNSSSAPGTHQSSTPAWHDQADKLAKVNTILGGIRDIMSTVGQGVEAAQGIQSMALTHQNNWYDKMRHDYALGPGRSTLWLGTKDDVSHMDRPVEVAPGLYMDGTAAQLFPEFSKGLGFKSGTYNLGVLARQDQHALVQRRNRIDGLVQDIFKELEGDASTEKLIRLFMELWAYTLIQNHGGGF